LRLYPFLNKSSIVNILDEVKLISKNMRIKATFDGLHIHNPISKIQTVNTGDVIEI